MMSHMTVNVITSLSERIRKQERVKAENPAILYQDRFLNQNHMLAAFSPFEGKLPDPASRIS